MKVIKIINKLIPKELLTEKLAYLSLMCKKIEETTQVECKRNCCSIVNDLRYDPSADPSSVY